MNRWMTAFLLALRIAIGWHFLYEGVWKLTSDSGAAQYATPWYVLQSSVGRLREYFERSAPGEPGIEASLARTDGWYDEIVRSLKVRNIPLAEDQKARLGELRDKVKLATAEARQGAIRYSDVVNFDWMYVRDEVLRLPPPQEGAAFTSLPYLQASAGPLRPVFRGLVRDMDGLGRLTPAAARAAIDERAGAILAHYASAGRPFTAAQEARLVRTRESLKSEITATLNDPGFRTRLEDYELMLQRVRRDAPLARAPFSRERLAEDRRKLDAAAGELLGFVNEPLAELAAQAETIATVDQLGAGPPPRPGEPARWIDRAISWGLTATGLCLLLGVFTPLVAAAAAGQLALFYLASPPLPGLPAAAMGGHYLYVDRNAIELIAACVVAAGGTGRWGLDAYLHRVWRDGILPRRGSQR